MAVLRLGMYREAEKQFKSALKQQEMVDTFLYLAKVSILKLERNLSSQNKCSDSGQCTRRVASFFRNIWQVNVLRHIFLYSKWKSKNIWRVTVSGEIDCHEK